MITILTRKQQNTHFLELLGIIGSNINKHYLLNLKQNQVHIAETYFIEQDSTKTLKELHTKFNLPKIV